SGKFFAHTPYAVLFGFKRELHDWFTSAGPGDVLLDRGRGVGQQEHQANGIDERRFTEIVRTVKDIQTFAEVNVCLSDRREVSYPQTMQLHSPRPLEM